MTEPMTVEQARKLIALCREVDAKATQNIDPYGVALTFALGTTTERDSEGRVAAWRVEQFGPDAAAIVLWRAGFGALLEIAENSLTCEMEYEATLRFLSPLAAWADREHAGWRTR